MLLRCKDKTQIWGAVSVRTIRDDYGNLMFYEGSFVDITEHKKIEKAERERKAAEAANQAKSIFLANMSHEIRTPMNAILGFSEILLNSSRNSEEKRLLKTIYSSGQSLLTLINDILDLSKIESGKFELYWEPVSIERLFNEIYQIFSYKALEKGLEIQINIENNIPGIISDETRLRQILINLTGNAVKFTDKGYIQIRAQGKQAGVDMIDLILEIKDTGTGIPEDQQERIFESFQQLTGQKAVQYGGTGLGLSISKRLTEMMGGKISVVSKVGKGSIFRLEFPGLKISDLKDQKNHSISDKEENKDSEIIFEPAVILVADDIGYNRELIKAYLVKTELKIIESENGRQSWDLIQDHHIDFILTDIRMPEMDGYETAYLIKKSEKFKHIPIVAMTASAMKEDAFKIESIFDGYLAKPLKKNQLVTELKKHLAWKSVLEPKAEKDYGEKDRIEDKENISQEIKARLPELIKILEDEFIARWHEIKDVFFLDDIAEFANSLKLLGEQYCLNFLKEYGENMYLRTESIEIDVIEKLMNEFPRLIAKIKNI